MYDNNSDIFGFILNGTEYYYIKNAQNDVTAIADKDGNVLANYAYDSWGKVTEITGNTALAEQNPIRYRSYYFDFENGFYYVSSRYYDPEIGRWINADNAIAGVGGNIRGYNLFAYCMNDPVNMSDHTGHWPQWIKKAASAVVNAVKKAVTVANTVKSAVSSASNILKASSKSLPKKGKPGSSRTLPNPDGTPKQKRWYGPDGNPERDRDYNHPGNMPFPHDHEWKNGERGKEHLPPDPSYKISWEPVIGAGLVVICTVGIIAIAADDLTGVGVADDFLFGPLGAGVGEGLIMIFG
ncbi:MAG: RHS repeat-associated core domain-containing protein, partial [Anaerotruncus sp.]|nr:RHS repeat-associated core domain-containing protein [Anaerotruncus sp.]